MTTPSEPPAPIAGPFPPKYETPTRGGEVARLYVQCCKFYEAMYETAEVKKIRDLDHLVWSGKVTVLFQSLGIPQGVYGKMMNQLYHLGCITKLIQGSEAVPSEFALHYHPSERPWTTPYRAGRDKPDLTARVMPATMIQLERRIDDLARTLGGLDLVGVLAEFQKRLDALQLEVNALKTERG